jgi:hypothetical protein
MTSRGSGDGNSPLSRPCVADGNPAPDDSGHSEPVPGRGRRKGSARARGGGSRRQASGGRPGLAWTSPASRAESLGGATSEPWRAARRRDWTANSPRPVTPRSRGRDPTEPSAVDRPTAGGRGVDGAAPGSRGRWPPTRRAKRGRMFRTPSRVSSRHPGIKALESEPRPYRISSGRGEERSGGRSGWGL